jgi:hypothetical protein
MDGTVIGRIETGTARGAAALFAAAVGYSAFGLATAAGLEPPIAWGAAAAGALAYWPCSRALGSRQGRRSFAIPEFSLRAFEFGEPAEELLLTERLANDDELLLTERLASEDELVLTDADRVDAALVLDDIVAELGPDSRVVRLFDRNAMAAEPTPGQLQSRISDHLKGGTPPFAPPGSSAASDASQALSAALAELRRSLR